MTFFDEEPPQPLGVVLDAERGALPFALLHGEPLVACAAWAMGEAGIRLLDLTTSWADVRDAGAPLVWHDSLCPMVPPDFLAACVRRAVTDGVVVVGVLPVTDTIKEIREHADGPVVGETVDRDLLVALASPIVIPAGVVAGLDDWPSADLARAVAGLRGLSPVAYLEAPMAGVRVESADDVRALEALTLP